MKQQRTAFQANPIQEPLDLRTREVLLGLDGARWMRPMDFGGRDASHHARTAEKLVRLGWVERRQRNTLANMRGSSRGSWEYRLTRRGAIRIQQDEEDQAP